MPEPFDKGVKRPAGVHLHWAMPDSLLDGTLERRDPGAENRLALPPLARPLGRAAARRAARRTRADVAGWVDRGRHYARSRRSPTGRRRQGATGNRQDDRTRQRSPAPSAARLTGAAATMRWRTAFVLARSARHRDAAPTASSAILRPISCAAGGPTRASIRSTCAYSEGRAQAGSTRSNGGSPTTSTTAAPAQRRVKRSRRGRAPRRSTSAAALPDLCALTP